MVNLIAFPKLKKLAINSFAELEDWEIPTSKDRKMMPLLSQLTLGNCPELRELPRVWRMEALEELELWSLNSMKGVGVEFVGDNEGSLQDGVTFPKLKELGISCMSGLGEWSVPLIPPCLKQLWLSGFLKLKRLPTFQGCVETLESLKISLMNSWEGQETLVINDNEGSSRRGGEGDSCGIRSLLIGHCSKLCGVPHYMFSPSSLEALELDGEVGVLYDDDSIPAYAALCSITAITLQSLPYSSLLICFDQLKALQRLQFKYCETLDCDLKELGHFTMLQWLNIEGCPHLSERFKGDDWRTILVHVPTIWIDGERIKRRI